MFKLALNAGHYMYTQGKRCHKDIDANETREWVLNDRICTKIQKILSGYDGIEVLRIDDTTGETDIPLKSRTDKANKWGADFYLAVHHNAAGKKFNGGGIVAYVYNSADTDSVEWQKALYYASVEATGLKGNRSTPLAKKNLHEVRETKMPSVLMECGFMDSTIDCPIILSEAFADNISRAISNIIIEKSCAKKKADSAIPQNKDHIIYDVKKGDTLWNLSKKYLGSGLKYTEIMKLNGISKLKAGMKIKIPIK